MNTTHITLGGNEYEVATLTLGQLRALGIGAAKMRADAPVGSEVSEAAFYDGAFAILGVALRKTPQEVEQIEGATLQELLVAQRVILETAGLVEKKAASMPGEAQAEA